MGGRVEHAFRYWKGTLFVYFKEENRVSQLSLSFHSSRFQKNLNYWKSQLVRRRQNPVAAKNTAYPSTFQDLDWLCGGGLIWRASHLTSRFPEFLWRTWKRGSGNATSRSCSHKLYNPTRVVSRAIPGVKKSRCCKIWTKNMLSGLSSRSWWNSFRTSNEELSSPYIFRENSRISPPGPPHHFFFFFFHFSQIFQNLKYREFVQFFPKKKKQN